MWVDLGCSTKSSSSGEGINNIAVDDHCPITDNPIVRCGGGICREQQKYAAARAQRKAASKNAINKQQQQQKPSESSQSASTSDAAEDDDEAQTQQQFKRANDGRDGGESHPQFRQLAVAQAGVELAAVKADIRGLRNKCDDKDGRDFGFTAIIKGNETKAFIPLLIL